MIQCAGLEEGHFAGVTGDYWNIRLVSIFKAMFVPLGRLTNIIVGFQALKTVCINNKRSLLHSAFASKLKYAMASTAKHYIYKYKKIKE